MASLTKRPRSVRQTAIILGLMFLTGALINVSWALHFINTPYEKPYMPDLSVIRHLRNSDASGEKWPTRTPHEQPWPEPTYWTLCGAFGYRLYYVEAYNPKPNRNYHRMEYQLIGWPLPVLQHVEMSWDWQSVIWETDADPRPPMQVHWLGLSGNSILFAVAVWFVLVAPFDGWRWWIRRRRFRRGCCVDCGYDLRASPGGRCSECGAVSKEKVDR